MSDSLLNDPVIHWLCQQLHKKVGEKFPDQEIHAISLSKIKGHPDNPLTLTVTDKELKQTHEGR